MVTINSVLFYVLLIIFRKFIFLLMTKMEQNLELPVIFEINIVIYRT